MFQDIDPYSTEYYAVTDARTCQMNSREKAKLQLVLRHIERAYKLAESRVDRYKQQLRRDLIDLEAHKMAMRSHALGFKQLRQLDDASQREMLKVVSQRGSYNYSLKSEVKFHRELMCTCNARLEHSKKLLEASKKQSQEAMAKGDLVCSQFTRLDDLEKSEVGMDGGQGVRHATLYDISKNMSFNMRASSHNTGKFMPFTL